MLAYRLETIQTGRKTIRVWIVGNTCYVMVPARTGKHEKNSILGQRPKLLFPVLGPWQVLDQGCFVPVPKNGAAIIGGHVPAIGLHESRNRFHGPSALEVGRGFIIPASNTT